MEEKKSLIKEIFDWLAVVVIAVIAALIIDNFIIVNAKIPSASMEQTIMTGDRVIGFRGAYLFSDPQRGDIVIFKYPDDESILYIKRIIGMPGDEVEIKDNVVYINGERYNEDYISGGTSGDFGPYKVPEGHYFMLGDNRNNSADSRYWNNTYLAKEKIVGKAVFRYWPSIKKL
ncbi:signal peptidase I Serine peptidase. MEROPS family S26A [Lachnospiraceae bacterium KH1T2]|nr:signal peptidase I Serine peptidase. MEROPS family S26A [Lachnospiraceae bacterium KH1T2]